MVGSKIADASTSTRGVRRNSLPSVATKPARSSVNRSRRAVARGRSAALARSLNVIGCWLPPNISSTRRPRSRLSTKSVAPRLSAVGRALELRHRRLQNPLAWKAAYVRIAQKFNRRTFRALSATWRPRHDEPGSERPDHPHRPQGPVRQADADVLAAGGAGRRAAGRAAGAARQTARREPRAVSRRGRPLRPDRPPLRASRRRPRLRPAREWRPALRLPWLAVRCLRPMPGDACGAEGLEALPGHQAALLSRRREERHPLGLSRRRRAAGLSGDRLLRRARQPYLCVQGPHRLQLAAGAGGRHRSGARLVPASLLRGRGSRRTTPTASSSAARPPAPTCR